MAEVEDEMDLLEVEGRWREGPSVEKDLLIQVDTDTSTGETEEATDHHFSVELKLESDGGHGGRRFVLLLTLLSVLEGFVFGYDTSVVSGAILKMRESFLLNSTWIEIIVSVTLAAAAVSAFLSGFLCDLIGRRPTLIISSIVFTVGAAILGVSYHTSMLVIGRIVVGVGIGMVAMAMPMYIAESAPASTRGKLVVMNIMFIAGGQFAATVVDGAFSYLTTDIGWRLMLGFAVLPSILMFVSLLFVPESPRWLIFHGKKDKALQVLRKIHSPEMVGKEFESIVEDFREHKQQKLGCGALAVKFCTTRSVLLALLVGCGLQFFQQFTGINTVMYYSASIIQMAGFPDQSAIWLATVPGGSNFIFTIIGLLLVDRLGRRKLLIGSISGMSVAFMLLSVTFVLMTKHSPVARPYYDDINGTCSFDRCGTCVGNSECGFCADFDPGSGGIYNGTCVSITRLHNGSAISRYRPTGKECAVVGEDIQQFRLNYSLFDVTEASSNTSRQWHPTNCPGNRLAPLAVVAMFLYIAFFAPGMSALPWTVNSEIYPTWARSTAISIATMTNWMCNLIVSVTFLTMADNLGQPVTFGVYAGLCSLALLFIVLFVPETKGRSLEEMDCLFQRPYFMSWCGKKS